MSAALDDELSADSTSSAMMKRTLSDEISRASHAWVTSESTSNQDEIATRALPESARAVLVIKLKGAKLNTQASSKLIFAPVLRFPRGLKNVIRFPFFSEDESFLLIAITSFLNVTGSKLRVLLLRTNARKRLSGK